MKTPLIIQVGGKPLDLPARFSMTVEDSSPIFNDLGSQSLPATVRPGRVNSPLLGYPHRLDTGRDPNRPEQVAVVRCGVYRRRGVVNVTEAATDGITFNIGFDNSAAYAAWTSRKLTALSGLPDVTYGLFGCIAYLERLMASPDPHEDPLAVFPVALSVGEADKEVAGTDGTVNKKTTVWEIINMPASGSVGTLARPRHLARSVDGVWTRVAVPDGYGITPFVRVWRLLELVFADLGVRIEANPFRTDPELCRLVVLNNVADAICTGRLNYAELMPDCTVGEFLTSLWVRFGLVYEVDYDAATVTLRFIRDILRLPATDVTGWMAGETRVTVNGPQYVRLSASTSIEGAAPVAERFEDLAAGGSLAITYGPDVDLWEWDPADQGGGWSGDSYYSEEWDPYDPEYPDPFDPEWPDDPWDDYDDDRDDGRDDDRERTAARSRAASRAGVGYDEFGPLLSREFESAVWYRLDSLNSTVARSGSSFFNWDPMPDGCEAMELTSPDECVPVGKAFYEDRDEGCRFSDRCPHFMVGARHFHSYIAGAGDAEEQAAPLSFMFAYDTGGTTYGRIVPERAEGYSWQLNDGTVPELSLLFQFRGGHYDKFWREFDEVLRHAPRTVEVAARIPAHILPHLRMTEPVRLRGVRFLPDSVSYDLPHDRDVAATLTLRAVTTWGGYDAAAELAVPGVSFGGRSTEWFIKADNRKVLRNRHRAAVVDRFISDTGYVLPESPSMRYRLSIGEITPLFDWRAACGDTAPAGTRRRITFASVAFRCTVVLEQAPAGIGSWQEVPGVNPVGRGEFTDNFEVLLVSRWVDE